VELSSSQLVSVALAWLGSFLFAWRIFPRPAGKIRKLKSKSEKSRLPRVSIVVPARNEESNIRRLLRSLKNLSYPSYEVYVVDDQSEDRTPIIAHDMGFHVIKGTPPPPGWTGKNWACHQVVKKLKGDIFLFTDADTEHRKDSLHRAVQFLQKSGVDMVSALPYHRLETIWEKLMGPFYAFLMAATAPYSPRPRRLFAIGQYLMFRRDSYLAQGGHASIRNQYPDDLALANACIKKGGRYRIFQGRPLFQVRMYPTFKDFIKGWRRNFLAGIQQSNLWTTLEVFLYFFGITGGGLFWMTLWGAVPMMAALVTLTAVQKAWGRFSFAGVLLLPFSLSLFCLITALAGWDYINGNVLKWRGRNYTGWVGEESHDI